MPPGRSPGGHGTRGVPAHLAGLTADPKAPDTRLSAGSVQAGGADYDGTVEEYVDETVPTKRAGRPKAKKENLPVHVIS